MSRTEDVVGKTFNRLTVVSQRSNGRRTVCKCICVCGNEKEVALDKLKSGHTKSCGCLTHDHTRRYQSLDDITYHRLWNIYTKMKRRCYTLEDPAYSYYGGRGISVCEEWRNKPTSFFNWALQNGYNNDLTIDRIDVNGNYEPKNCRWATKAEQALNKRNNFILEYKGVKKPLSEWVKEYQFNRTTLLNRLKRGWSVEEALTRPLDNTRRNRNAKHISKGEKNVDLV